MKKEDFLEKYLNYLNEDKKPPELNGEDLELTKILKMAREIKGAKNEKDPEPEFVLKLEDKLQKEFGKVKKEEEQSEKEESAYYIPWFQKWVMAGVLAVVILMAVGFGGFLLFNNQGKFSGTSLVALKFNQPVTNQSSTTTFGDSRNISDRREETPVPAGVIGGVGVGEVTEEGLEDTASGSPVFSTDSAGSRELALLSQDFSSDLADLERDLAEIEDFTNDTSLDNLDNDLADFMVVSF